MYTLNDLRIEYDITFNQVESILRSVFGNRNRWNITEKEKKQIDGKVGKYKKYIDLAEKIRWKFNRDYTAKKEPNQWIYWGILNFLQKEGLKDDEIALILRRGRTTITKAKKRVERLDEFEENVVDFTEKTCEKLWKLQ